MTKRPNGAGSVRTVRRPGRPDRFQALAPALPGGQRPSLGVYETWKEADGVRRAAVRQLVDEAGGARIKGTTLRAAGARYLETADHDLPRSARVLHARWAKLLSAPFVDDPIDLIGTPQIQGFLTALARRLPGTAPGVKALLSGIFGAEARAGHVTANPVGSVKLPRRVRTHEPWTYLTLEEQQRLVAAPAPEWVRLMLIVWLYTGLRPGEICALRIADVHLERASLVVRHGSLHGPPKGRRIRTVHMAPPAVGAMRRWLALLPAFAPTNPHGLVFPGERGGARRSGHVFRYHVGDCRNVHDAFEDALVAADVLRIVDGKVSASHRHDGQVPRCHDLRHTCGAALVSGMWGTSWRMEEVQQHLGHATISQTQRYAHLAPGVVGDLAARTAGVGVGYALDTAWRASPSFSDDSGRGAKNRNITALPDVPRRNRAPYPTRNQPAHAATLCRRALEAAEARKPTAGRLLVEACEAALEALEDVRGLDVAVSDAPPGRR